MEDFPQFILCRGKMPVDWRTGRTGDAQDPNLWLTAEVARAMASQYGSEYAIGFVFTKDDPFFFLDIDKCLNPDGKAWSPLAMELLGRLPGAAVEVSQSGQGLHVFGRGAPFDHSCKNTALGIELYTEGRFVALTGTGAIGSANVDCSATLPTLVSDYFTPKSSTKNQDWTDEPVESWGGIIDDDKLIKKALASSSAGGIFGGRATFTALWNAEEEPLSKSYPDQGGGRAYDSSSADAALAQHLAFWTGNNCERILTLMRRSALAREKWEREDYLIRTITHAVSLQTTFHGSFWQANIEKPSADVEIVTGYQYQSASLQIEHFKRCVYVQDQHRVFTPSGVMLKSEQFNATYGGFSFQLEGAGDKVTRKAWEAFTESQVVRYPKAESTCFRPELPSAQLIEEEGRILVNTYVPIETDRTKGDASPFLAHLEKVLPVQTDRDILLAYMAAIVQHKGVKFQWAPLLQGVEGNGKTLFTRCVAFAIGSRYTHLPPANEIAEKFNEWLFNKIFIGVEDVYVADHKQEVIEVLKPMITNAKLAMRAMQQAQVMGDNRANFMLNSNHKDAVRKSRNDRRFAVFFSAQQSAEDIIKDGMGGDYFPKLYQWLNDGGYAIVADFLATYQIPAALNPATDCHRAPVTSSTDEVVLESVGHVGQEILEAIEGGRPGFAGGWVSSVALGVLLREIRAERTFPLNKRRELLRTLGYDYHPLLKEGRVNNPVPLEAYKKPRLFIKKGHLALNLTTATEVTKAYVAAQGVQNEINPQRATVL